MVKRLPPHLRNVHRLNPEEVKKTLAKARGRVPDSHRVPYHLRRETMRDGDHLAIVTQPSGFVSISDSDSEDCLNHNAEAVETGSINNEAHEVALKFRSWLESADGGQLDRKTSEQHSKQVLKLLTLVDERENLASLYDDNLIDQKFLQGYAKQQYHPKTTQSYLMSLRHFYSFSYSTDNAEDIPKDKVVALREKITRWSSSFRNSCAKRQWQKMETDLHQLITPEQIKEFETSEAARNAVTLLGKLSSAHNIEVTQSRYTLIRDFLIVEISIDNANRSGSISNMKMGEFKRIKKEGNEKVIFVKEHKTLSTHGPARIILSEKLASWLQIFVREVRCKVYGASEDDNSCVFLSWTGEALRSSQVNKAMKSIWKKVKVVGAPSSTLIRKSAVSGVHRVSESSGSHSDLADLMAHDVGTARRYYKLQEKSKGAFDWEIRI